MSLLPKKTALPGMPIARRHQPAAGSYKTYIDCLRWDFGFTCPFCLLHEADLCEHDCVRTAQITIEHRALRSGEPERTNVYANCFLACRFCNSRRHTKPVVDDRGRSLLDPTTAAWAEHFEWDGFALKPRPGDEDAEYTWWAYQIDDAKRSVRRQSRCELIERTLELLPRAVQAIEKLQSSARRAAQQGNEVKARAKLNEARTWQGWLETAIKQLLRYRAVPEDKPERCRCGIVDHHVLPGWLDAQTREIPELTAGY